MMNRIAVARKLTRLARKVIATPNDDLKRVVEGAHPSLALLWLAGVYGEKADEAFGQKAKDYRKAQSAALKAYQQVKSLDF